MSEMYDQTYFTLKEILSIDPIAIIVHKDIEIRKKAAQTILDFIPEDLHLHNLKKPLNTFIEEATPRNASEYEQEATKAAYKTIEILNKYYLNKLEVIINEIRA